MLIELLWNWAADECQTDYGMLIVICWLASAKGIQKEWPGCDCWLTLANSIQDGWPGCAWWLTSANGIRDEWLSCDC
jgi:hypothetical protein